MFNTDNHIKKVCILLMNNLFLSLCVLVGFHIDAHAQTFSAPTVTFSNNFSTDKWITEPFTFSISGSDLSCPVVDSNINVRYWFNQELEASQGQNAHTQDSGSRGEIFTCNGYQGQQGILTLYAQVYCAAHEEYSGEYSEIYKVTFKYDDQAPIVSGKLSNGVIKINATDYTSGVQYYGISKSKEVYPTEWSTDNKFTPSEYGSYYLFAKDAAGNIGVSKETVNSVTPINNYPVNITGTYSYTGQAIKPNITVYDTNNPGLTLMEGQDYTFSLFNNVNAGTATVTINGIGNYTGSVTKTFKIEKAEQIFDNNSSIVLIETGIRAPYFKIKDNFKITTGDGVLSAKSSDTNVFVIKNGKFIPKSSGIAYLIITASETNNFKETSYKCKVIIKPTDIMTTSMTSKKSGQINIKWSSWDEGQATGFQIQVSTSKSFAKNKTKTYKIKGENKKNKNTKTIKGLKRGKKYYVRIRSYKTNSEGTVYGDYSSKKTVKVK
ncbi:MAG: fibronectin type III domain-containing protein [Clostridiales bacterium]|nr:fibronectin type III domain-containing protein [Clostridiales bacterium]